MSRLCPLVLVLAVLAGCGGGDDATDGSAHTETLPRGAVSTQGCLGDRGFSIRPAATGVSAVSPSGVEFTVAFFDSEAEAAAAAEDAASGSAVGNAVVTMPKKRLPRAELAAVEECIRG